MNSRKAISIGGGRIRSDDSVSGSFPVISRLPGTIRVEEQIKLIESAVDTLTYSVFSMMWQSTKAAYPLLSTARQQVLESLFNEIGTKIIPALPHIIAHVLRAIPYILSSKFLPYVVPYLIWQTIVEGYTREEAKLSNNRAKSELEQLTEQLVFVNVEKNNLRYDAVVNRRLHDENIKLRRRVRDYEQMVNDRLAVEYA